MGKKRETYLIPVSIIIASLIVSGAILYSSFLISGSLIVSGFYKDAGTLAPSGQAAAPAPTAAVSADDDPAKGPANARITIIEFSDFQCPFCKKFVDTTLNQIIQEYGDKVKLVFRDFPLSFHQYASKAAEAAECADEQGKFWEYHDLLFQKQSEWSVEGAGKFKDYATELGLNTVKFDDCLDTGKYAEEVTKDYKDGVAAGVSGTPTFFINGQKLVGALPFSAFKEMIDAGLAA